MISETQAGATAHVPQLSTSSGLLQAGLREALLARHTRPIIITPLQRPAL